MGDREMPKQVHKKLGSIASIRDFLEDELGQERLYQAYPVLRDFGDDILFEEKSDDLVAKLSHVLTKAEVKKYQNFFALLIFHDMQADDFGGGVDGMLSAAATLKGISNMTANFGRYN